MKKILLIFLLTFSIYYSIDNISLPKFLYIIEVEEAIYPSEIPHGIRKGGNYMTQIGIIEITNNKNKIYKTVIDAKDEKNITSEGKEKLQNFNSLLKIKFSNCNLDYLKFLDDGIPILLKDLSDYKRNDGVVIKRGMAIINKQTYEQNFKELKFPAILTNSIKEKRYFCPEYYNGE